MKRSVLSLREYDSATIGARWDPGARVVPETFVAALEALQRRMRRDVFAIERRRITAQQFVGTLQVGRYTVEILPKTDSTPEDSRVRLTRMLAIAGLVPAVEPGLPARAASAPTLLDAILLVYVERLACEWRRGRLAGYRREYRNRVALKGKLDVSRQVRRNMLHPERFFTGADEFLCDVPLSRLLKAAARVCREQATLHRTRMRATEVLEELDEVSDVTLTKEARDRIAVDRRHARFAPLVALAKLILDGRSPERAGERATYSLLFDMNVVFERFIGNLLRARVCPPRYRARLQHTGRWLVYRGGKPRFALRPDIGIFHEGELVCLIDTKWKLLGDLPAYARVDQSDMYQMYAYAREYQAPAVVLLYPRVSNMEPYAQSYAVADPVSPKARIEVRTVDVTRPPTGSDAATVTVELREMLAEVVSNRRA